MPTPDPPPDYGYLLFGTIFGIGAACGFIAGMAIFIICFGPVT